MFEGNKFYCVEEVVSYDSWGQKVLKPRFIMTRSYKKYLEEKQKENALKELRGLRAKLEYQKQTYGY